MKNPNKKIDIKKGMLLLIPIALGVIIFIIFLSPENQHSTKMDDEHIPLVPSIEEEKLDISKVDAYKEVDDNFRKKMREIDESVVSSDDFYTAVSGSDNNTQQNLTLSELYENKVTQKKKSVEKHPESYSSTPSKKTAKTNNTRYTYIDDLSSPPTKNNIEELYDQSIYASQYSDPEPAPSGYQTSDGKRRREKSTANEDPKNLIQACIHGDQTVLNGATVRLRLLENLNIENSTIPENTIFYGIASIGNERMNILVNSIKYNNVLHHVNYTIYDNDAIIGLNLPDNVKEQLAKKSRQEGINSASIPSSGGLLGTAVDVGTGIVKNVASARESQIKVTLKSNYKLFLK